MLRRCVCSTSKSDLCYLERSKEIYFLYFAIRNRAVMLKWCDSGEDLLQAQHFVSGSYINASVIIIHPSTHQFIARKLFFCSPKSQWKLFFGFMLRKQGYAVFWALKYIFLSALKCCKCIPWATFNCSNQKFKLQRKWI